MSGISGAFIIFILQVLCYVFNLSIQIFIRLRPTPLQLHIYLELAAIQNYGPVCLHSFLSNTLECAIFNQSNYLSQNDLLDPLQSGIKALPSTRLALMAVTEAQHTAKSSSRSFVLPSRFVCLFQYSC